MSSIKLDSSGDIDFTNGQMTILNLNRAEYLEETAQRLRLKLKTFLGEWFLDDRVGMPYREYFLIKNPRPSVMRAIFRETIINDEQVDRLDDLSLDYDGQTRSLTMAFSATLLTGEILEFDEFILEENL